MNTYLQEIAEGGRIVWDEALEACGEKLPLLKELAQTPQEPLWHGEGDVATHCKMVLEALSEITAQSDLRLSPERRLALWLGTWLHDIGKPLVTVQRDIKGTLRWVSPHHAQRGASYLAYRLFDTHLPPRLLLSVLSLVALHHEPKRIVQREASPARQWMLAEACDTPLLYLLEAADMTGRICPDQREQLEIVELFRMMMEECGAFHPAPSSPSLGSLRAPRLGYTLAHLSAALKDRFGNQSLAQRERLLRESLWALADGQIHHPEEALARAYTLLQRDEQPSLLLTVGLSGCGKSTWVQENAQGAQIISMDAIRDELHGDANEQRENQKVFFLARERLKEGLRKGHSMIWEATSLRREQRQALISLGRDYGAHTTLAVFCTGLSTLQRRNQQRQKAIPQAVLQRQSQAIEWPSLEEAHRLFFVDANGDTFYDSREKINDLL